MKLYVHQAEFLRGFVEVEDLPLENIPEVVFLGRSNVGKSSLINRFVQRKSLARTSSTPGRTQEINYFQVTYAVQQKAPQSLHVVDFPGYGYAKLSHSKKKDIGRLVVSYLRAREIPYVVCLLNDCRRDPERDEQAIVQECFDAGGHLLVVLTKCDKLKKTELQKRQIAISKAYGLEPQDLVLTGTDTPIELLWERVLLLF